MGKIISKETAISTSLLIINFMFYVTVFWCFLIPVITVYTSIFPESPLSALDISQTITSREIQFVNEDLPDDFRIARGVVLVNASYLIDHHLGHFLVGLTWRMILFILSAYVLWLFRKILLCVQKNTVFDEDNAKRLRTVSLIFLIFWIFESLTAFFNYGIFNTYFESISRGAVVVGDLHLGYFASAALIFTLSLVFEKAQDIYHEQKLTV